MPLTLTGHPHQNAGGDDLRSADPVDRLVIPHDPHFGHADAHLSAQYTGKCCGGIAGTDAADLPDCIQFQAVQFSYVFIASPVYPLAKSLTVVSTSSAVVTIFSA